MSTNPTASDETITSEQDAAHEVLTQVEAEASSSGLLDGFSRFVVGIIVLAVWGFLLVFYGLWLLKDVPQFVCTVPGDPAAASYTGTCQSGRTATFEQFKDFFATFVLPVVTLVIGYYFGRAKAEAENA
jgi:hypothetical protein